MKKRLQISLLISPLAGVCFTSRALAQSTLLAEPQIKAAIQQITPELDRDVNRWLKFERERRSAQTAEYQAQQQALATYRRGWAKRLQNPAVAALLGDWYGPFGYAISIFPSRTPNSVCVQSIDEEGTSISSQQVRGDKLLWSDSKQAGATFKYKGILASVLITPVPKVGTTWSYSRPPQLRDENRQKAEQLGCLIP
jgi:hypothetical protein